MLINRDAKIRNLLEAAVAPQTMLPTRLETVKELLGLMKPERDLDLLEKVFHLPNTSLAVRELILRVAEGLGGDSASNALMRVAINVSIDPALRFQAYLALKTVRPEMSVEKTPHVVRAARPDRSLLLREVGPDEVYDPSDPRCADETYLEMIRTLTKALLWQTA